MLYVREEEAPHEKKYDKLACCAEGLHPQTTGLPLYPDLRQNPLSLRGNPYLQICSLIKLNNVS